MSPRRRPFAAGRSAAVFALGASGPVGGGWPRRIAVPPRLDLAAAISGNHPGEPIAGSFPNPAGASAWFVTGESAVGAPRRRDCLRTEAGGGEPGSGGGAA